jgi:hypothetical protein
MHSMIRSLDNMKSKGLNISMQSSNVILRERQIKYINNVTATSSKIQINLLT